VADPEPIDLGDPVADALMLSIDLTAGVLDDASFRAVLACAVDLAQDGDAEVVLGLLVVRDPSPAVIRMVADGLRAVDAIGLLDDGTIAILFGAGSRRGAATALQRAAGIVGAAPGCGDVQAVLNHRSGPVDASEDLASATRALLQGPLRTAQSEVRARR